VTVDARTNDFMPRQPLNAIVAIEVTVVAMLKTPLQQEVEVGEQAVEGAAEHIEGVAKHV
jgi:hypothetical protein